MKQFAQNLEKRMIASFSEQNLFSISTRCQAMRNNIDIADASIQNLLKEYDCFLRNRKPKDEIHFYKNCYPIVGRWQFYWEFMLSVEKNILLLSEELRHEYLKKMLQLLQRSFKKKR